MPDAAHLKNAEAGSDDQLPTEDKNSFEAQARKACRLGVSLLSHFSGNCVLSPRSVGIVLMMLAQGASSKIRESMAQVICTDPNVLKRCRDQWPNDPNTYEEANAFWYDEKLAVKAEYVKSLHRDFDALVEPFDPSQSEKAADTVNAWASEKTRGCIEEVIGPEAFEPLAAVFANAVYFKGLWEDPFDLSLTRDGPFHLASGAKVRVPMMTKRDVRLPYAGTNDFQAVALPYKGAFEMVIILPKKRTNLETVTRRLLDDAPTWLAREFPTCRGSVILPRFEITWREELNGALKEAGLGALMTSPDSFPSISDGPMTVPNIAQKAFIGVDEKGSEAAAVTTAVRLGCTRRRPDGGPFKMIVDRPFLFAIRHMYIPVPLFLGRVENPSRV